MALSEKLTYPQLVKKYPKFYETRKYMITFTKACWDTNHGFPPLRCKTYFNILIPFIRLSSKVSVFLRFATTTLYASLSSLIQPRAQSVSVFLILSLE